MPNAKKAAVNGERSIRRIVGRLSRVYKSLDMLDTESKASGVFDVAYRRRCADKAERLKQEASRLSTELNGIRETIEDIVK